MSTLSGTDLPKPTDWEDFERKTCVLIRCVLNDPHTQQNGRQGQPQHGVDVYGYREADTTRLVGVQCKKKFANAVTEDELEEELGKALKFKPKITEFILVTTAPRDQKLQEKARLLTEKLSKSDQALRVVVWGWEDIREHAANHLPAWKAFDPTHSPYVETQHVEMLEALRDVKESVLEAVFQSIQSKAAVVTVDKSDRDDTELFGLMKAYEGLVDGGNAKLALDKLRQLKQEKWAGASEAERYRLFATMAKAQLQLGNEEDAGELLLRAVDAFPLHPKASLTKAKGYFLQHDLKTALAESEPLLGHPELGEEASGIAIQCRCELGLADKALDGVPEELREKAHVSSAVIMGKRIVGDSSWIEEAFATVELHPTDHFIKWFAADAHLERALKAGSEFDPTTTLSTDGRGHLEEAEKLYVALLADDRYREYLPASLASNAALMFRMLDDEGRASEVLARGRASDKDDPHLLLQQAAIARNNNDFPAVLKLLPNVTGSAEIDILRAEALAAEGQRQDALAIIDGIKLDNLSLGLHLSALATKAKCLCENDDPDEAKKFVNALLEKRPYDPGYLALGIKVSRVTEGDERAGAFLDERIGAIRKDADLGAALELAHEAHRLKRHKSVVDLLDGRIALDRKSDGLMLLLSAAIDGNIAKKATDILAALPEQLCEDTDVLRAQAVHAIRVGHPKAGEAVDRYRMKCPFDLDMVLTRVGLFQRVGDEKGATDVLSVIDPSLFNASPAKKMLLAHAFVQFGRVQDGVRLGYEILVQNWDNAVVHLRYHGLLLAKAATQRLIPNLATVSSESVVTVKNERGEGRRYRLEKSAPLAFVAEHVAEDSDLGKLLLGKAVGDEIDLGGSGSPRIYKVAAVQHPWLDALQSSLEEFNTRFPRSNGMIRYEFDPCKENPLAEMKQVLKAAAEQTTRTFDYYRDNAVPFLFVSSFIGRDPIDSWLALISEGRVLRVALGLLEERNAAIAALKARKRGGCVLDPVTLALLKRLGVEHAVRKVCGPLMITHSVLDVFVERAEEARQSIGHQQGFMSYRNDNVQVRKLTADDLSAALKAREEELAWARTLEVVPAIPAEDLSVEQSTLIDMMEDYAWEPVVATQGKGALLLSEDMILRNWATSSFKVETCWLQPVLLTAREEGFLSSEAYSEAVNLLAQSHHHYTAIHPEDLKHQFRKDDFEVTEALKSIISMTSGPTANLETNTPVLVNGIILSAKVAEESGVPQYKICRFAGEVFSALVRGRKADQTNVVLSAVTGKPRWLKKAAVDWLVGHSLGTPEFAELLELQKKMRT